MKKFAFISFFILLTGLGFALYFGNQPEILYYSDGNIKSIAKRKFFQKHGEYNILTPDGVLSQQYNLVNGIKNGKAKIYTSYFMPIELNYINGNMSGQINIDESDIPNNIDDFSLRVYKGNFFELNIKNKQNYIKSSGKFGCDDEVLIDNFQKLVKSPDKRSLKQFLGCIVFNKISFKNKQIQCLSSGAYQFPKFIANTKFNCNGGIFNKEGIDKFKNLNIDAEFNVGKKALIIKTVDNENNQTTATSNFKGTEKILESLINISVSENKNNEFRQWLSDILRYFTISNSTATYNNQKITSTVGDFNFIKGFSNPYIISYFTNNKTSSQIKLTDKSVLIKSKYPSNFKPMMAITLNINESIRVKYNELVTKLLKEIKHINFDSSLTPLVNYLLNYSLTFSDAVKSASIVIWNNDGEKVFTAIATINGSINFKNLAEDITKNVDFKIITHKNGTPDTISKGNFYNGFTINDQKATYEQVIDEIKKSDLEKTLTSISQELGALYENIEINILQDNYTSADPLLLGIYRGYTSTMEKYIQNKTSEQITRIISNIKNLYSSKDSYNGLNNEKAIALGVVANDMVTDIKSAEIKNAAGGYVTIKSSKANSIDTKEHQSFVVEFGGLSKDNCISLATSYYMIDTRLIGTAAGQQKQTNSANSFSNIGDSVNTIFVDTGKNGSGLGFAYASKSNISFVNAIRACSGEGNTNSVAFKYR